MRVFRSPVILKHNPHQRPIYMVPNLATLKSLRLVSDVPRLNIVVLKPMPSKRSQNALFRGYPWMEDRIVTYYGVEAVPDVLREPAIDLKSLFNLERSTFQQYQYKIGTSK